MSVKVEDISLGSSHTLCVLRNGKVLCWGSSKDGKMGLEASLDRNFLIPKELITLDKEKIFQVSAGPFHSLALTENGSIYSFGNYKDGKLGFDENQNVLIPKKLSNGITYYKKYDQDSDNI
jgi:alpha-tubulin suppressor-like RCC1 family protein